MPLDDIVIVGASQAGTQIAASLRQSGYQGRLRLLGEERQPPYRRPPLSKGYLQGKIGQDALLLYKEDFYLGKNIELRLGERVVSINRQDRCVQTRDGEALPYQKLALAVGARVRKLSVPGSELAGIHYLRTPEDVDVILQGLTEAKKVAVIGGSFLGLEVAASIAEPGRQITVIEAAGRLMPRVGAGCIAQLYLDQHRQHGVTIHTGKMISEFSGRDGKISEVHCTDGCTYPAELVIVSIGVEPNVELAKACKLKTGNGIVVDEFTRTSDTDIVAAGDCALHPNPWKADGTGSLRLESIQNANDQARAAAAALLDDLSRPYHKVPWFWSDQYDLKLQMAGLSAGHDEQILRGSVSAAGYSVFYFQRGKLIGADSVNRPADHAAARKLLAARAAVSPSQAADEQLKLKSLL